MLHMIIIIFSLLKETFSILATKPIPQNIEDKIFSSAKNYQNKV